MRIAIVTGFFLPVPAVNGGATERSWDGLAKLFAEKGHDVTFISRRVANHPANETHAGVKHVRIGGFDHTKSLARNLILDLIWGTRVARALPIGDIVICNTITLPIWLRLFRPSAGKVAVMIGRTPKGQVSSYRGVQRIYVPSTSVAAKISSKWTATRTRVIGYPIDWVLHDGFSNLKNAPITLGFIGRIHSEKGLGILIDAVRILAERKDLPDWNLKIVGPHRVSEGGEGEEWLSKRMQQTEALGSRVQWLGPQFDPVGLARLYGGMDVFCYPSIAAGETFGVAVAEAMAARCAVIVSGLACFNDLIEDGQTGLIFDHTAVRPEQLLANAIGRLISDPTLRNNLAQNGQQRVRKYDYPAVAQLILDDLAVLTRTPPELSQQSDHA